MPTDVKNIQATLDSFEATDMKRQHDKQSPLVGIGAATQAIGTTLRKIKEQKDATRAQGVIDRARAVKDRLNLMLQGKTAEEQEEVMASSAYQDAYSALKNDALAIGGTLGGAAEGTINSLQQAAKLSHLSGLMRTMGAERKDKVKDALIRFRSNVAVDPDSGNALAGDVRASLMMFMQTDAQREELNESLKRNYALGALDAFTNKGPANSPQRALEMLDDKRIAKYLTAKQIRTYRNYVAAQLKTGGSKSATVRNDIMGYAANTGDLASMARSLEDPTLEAAEKKQIKTVLGVARGKVLAGQPLDAASVDKMLIKNPKSKADRDFNRNTRSVAKKLGEMYEANPMDAVMSVMGPEYEAVIGNGDAVTDHYGSRMTSERAAQITTDALSALEDGTVDAFTKAMQDKYKGTTNSMLVEGINRHYYGKTDARSLNEKAALVVSYNSSIAGMFKPEQVANVLAQNPQKIPTGYVPEKIQELKNTLSDDEYAAVVRTLQATSAAAIADAVRAGGDQQTQKYEETVLYNDEMDRQAGFMGNKTVDMQRRKSFWPDPMNGLLRDGKSVVLPAELIGSMPREQAMENRNKVRADMTPANLRRYAVNFDKFTNELLQDDSTQVYLKRDPQSDGLRFNVVMASPTGVTHDPGIFSFEVAETRENLLTNADGSTFQVGAEAIYKHGTLFPPDWDKTPREATLTDTLMDIKERVGAAVANKIGTALFGLANWGEGTEGYDRAAADRQVAAEEAAKNIGTLPTASQAPLAPIYNLPAKEERAWRTDVRPALLAQDSKWKGAAGKLDQNTKLTLMKAIGFIESRFDPKAVSSVGAAGVFQLYGVNKKGVDPHDTKQAAGRAIEVMSAAYNRAEKLAKQIPGANKLDTLVMAARIYNGGKQYATIETFKKTMAGESSTGTRENPEYANKLYQVMGFLKRLKKRPGSNQADIRTNIKL